MDSAMPRCLGGILAFAGLSPTAVYDVRRRICWEVQLAFCYRAPWHPYTLAQALQTMG